MDSSPDLYNASISFSVSFVGSICFGNDTSSGFYKLANGIGYSTSASTTVFTAEYNAAAAILRDMYFGFRDAQFAGGTVDTRLYRDAANTLALRNGTAAQRFNVYNTWTSTTNYEAFKIDWITTANTVLVGTEKGSGGGTARALAFQTDGTTRLTIGTTGGITATGSIDIGSDIYVGRYVVLQANRANFSASSSGVVQIANDASPGSGFGRLQFGGSTSSFPALKRSSTTLQARLADDSDFAPVQGKLTTETAYTAGDPTTTGYIIIYDSTGTAYRVPALAN